MMIESYIPTAKKAIAISKLIMKGEREDEDRWI
jgi:hypothetical protein